MSNHSNNTIENISFPLKWLTTIVVIEMIVIGLSVWLIGYTEVRVREGMTRQVRLERLHGDIVHLDEVLTMSAKMAAASGDLAWEQRYLKYEPMLDEKIQEVITASKALDIDLNDLGISTTNAANEELVAMENEAFSLVSRGNKEKALNLLTSAKYTTNKSLYAAGLSELLARLDELVTNLGSDQKNQVKLVQIFGGVGWVLLITVWLGVLLGIRKWRMTLNEAQHKLGRYQSQLEQRVFVMAKELTLAEHRERQRIAGLLHDNLQQTLVAAKLQLSLDTQTPSSKLIAELLDESLSLSRNLTNELNPPGLMLAQFADALEWLADWVQTRHGLDIDLKIKGDLANCATEIKVIAFDGIREVFFNIVKHAQTKSTQMTARMEQNGFIQINITDNGVGFNLDLIKKGEGFGLLNIIRRLELVGGSLEMQSKIGKGSNIKLLIPSLQESDRFDTNDQDTSLMKRTSKVLIVDDHPIVRAGLISALKQRSKFEFYEAGSYSEVLKKLESLSPDIAILDFSLGSDKDGADVAAMLKGKNEDIKMIAFTSYDDAVSRRRMMDAGVSAYLIKGCDSQELVAAIEN